MPIDRHIHGLYLIFPRVQHTGGNDRSEGPYVDVSTDPYLMHTHIPATLAAAAGKEETASE